MQVEIVTPESILFNGDADMVIAKGTAGEFGVLAGHEPMVQSLAFGELRLYVGDTVQDRFAIFGGFLEVRNDVVSVLSDGAVAKADIAEADALAQLAAAEALPADDPARGAALAKAKVLVQVSESK